MEFQKILKKDFSKPHTQAKRLSKSDDDVPQLFQKRLSLHKTQGAFILNIAGWFGVNFGGGF